MGSDKRKERPAPSAIERRECALRKIDKCLEKLVEGLPGFNPKEFARAVDAIKEYPDPAFRLLCKRLAGKDAAVRALACWAVSETLSPAVAERLKAMAFDELLPAEARAQATEYLARLGQPVDPEVLEMSLPNAAEILDRLPVRVVDAMREGQVEEAARRFGALQAPEQAVLVHRLAAELKDAAAPLFEKVAGESEALGEAVVAAVASHHLGACAGLLRRLAESDSKALHKAARKALYALKSAGCDVSGHEEAAQPVTAAQEEPADADLPLCKAVVAESRQGNVCFFLAVERPNGRLKTLYVLVNVWGGGILKAGMRPAISKSQFAKTLKSMSRDFQLREADMEEIRRIAARGLASTQALGLRVPLDFQLGRDMLGDLDALVAEMGSPFRCTTCGAALGESALQAVKDAAVYSHVQVEKQCSACRASGVSGEEGQGAGE